MPPKINKPIAADLSGDIDPDEPDIGLPLEHPWSTSRKRTKGAASFIRGMLIVAHNEIYARPEWRDKTYSYSEAERRTILALLEEVTHMNYLTAGINKSARADLVKRIEALEARPSVHDAGVWTQSQTYPKGAAVTFGGSLWISQIDGNISKPSKDRAWRLAVKKGRDGKGAAE